jgi:hypothetical protein
MLKQGVKISVRVLQGTKAKRKDSHSKTGSYSQKCDARHLGEQN